MVFPKKGHSLINFIRDYYTTVGYKVSREPIAIPVKGHSTYVDPQTYACPDEAVEEFAKEIEPKMLRLDSEIGAGEFICVIRVDSILCIFNPSVLFYPTKVVHFKLIWALLCFKGKGRIIFGLCIISSNILEGEWSRWV